LVFAWNGHGRMNVYHVPVSQEDMREWWDPITSLRVTWTLRNVPRATVVKGDNCAMGPENKVNRNFGSRGLERKVSLEVSRTKNLKLEVLKSRSHRRLKNCNRF
jgi:hypothetical protein